MMERRITKATLFLSSFGLYISVFLGMKIIAIGLKVLMCELFSVDFLLQPFWIKPISAVDSGVWDFDSVYSIYSVDVLVPLLGFLVSWHIFSRIREVHPPSVLVWIWVMFVSLTTFFATFIAGPVTRSNSYHLLQWFYLPNHLIMAISLLAIPLLAIAIWKLSPMMLKLAPETSWLQTDIAQRRVVIVGGVLPVLAGIIAISLAAGKGLDKYLVAELGGQCLAAVVLLISQRPQPYRPIEGAIYLPAGVYLLWAFAFSSAIILLLWLL